VIDQNDNTFTREEVDHLVAREVAKQRMADLERQLGSTNNEVVKMSAELRAQLTNILRQIEIQRSEIKAEIKEDFATKMDLLALESKVDKIWLKISIPVSVIVAVSQMFTTHFIK